MTCAIDGCDRKAHAKGLCGMHYQRKWVAALNRPKRQTHEEWFLDAIKMETGACIMWPFSRNRSNGRGYVRFEGRRREASRLACELKHGLPPTPSHEAAHSCGKGHLGCINPKHLRWATKAENEADKVLHGTSNRGERCGSAKLSEPEALEIRRLATEMPHKVLAAHYGVSRATIGDILHGKSWRHV